MLLLAATIAGELAARLFRLPRLLGYVGAGMLLGPHAGGMLDTSTLRGLRVLVDVSLGLVLFELGHRLNVSWLRRNPWLLVTSLLEAGLSFVAILAVLRLLDVAPIYATAAAAIGVGTSPAVVLHVTRELRAQGQVTERLLLLSALNSIYAVVGLAMWLGWLHLEYQGNRLTVALHPVYLIVGSLLLAVLASLAARLLPKTLRTREDAELLMILGLVVLLIEVAFALRASVLLTLLAFGVLAKWTAGWPRALPRHFPTVTSVFMVVLFALIGASLDPGTLGRVGFIALAFVAARLLIKLVVVTATASPSGLSLRKGLLLGLGMTPMSGLAIVLVEDTTAIYPNFGTNLLVIVLATVTVLEIAGPVLTKIALTQSKETRPE